VPSVHVYLRLHQIIIIQLGYALHAPDVSPTLLVSPYTSGVLLVFPSHTIVLMFSIVE
jgi:hypothetical protein